MIVSVPCSHLFHLDEERHSLAITCTDAEGTHSQAGSTLTVALHHEITVHCVGRAAQSHGIRPW